MLALKRGQIKQNKKETVHFVSEFYVSEGEQMEAENPWAFHIIPTGATTLPILQIRKLRTETLSV